MNTYVINSIDSQGNASVTVVIGERTFVQNLCNLPVNDPGALQGVLTQYVQDYASSLNAPDSTPQAVAALVDQTIPVS